MNEPVSKKDMLNGKSLEDLRADIGKSLSIIQDKESVLIDKDNNLTTKDYIDEISHMLVENYYKNDIHMLYFADLQLKDLVLNMDDIDNFKKEIIVLYNFCLNYNSIINKYFFKFHKQMIGEIEKFGKLNDILKNHKTYEIYKKSEDVNHKKYIFYIAIAILFAIIGFFFSIFSKAIYTQCFFGNLCILEYNDIDYWIMKAGIIFITITGVTFCLKQAIHHQKKKDKAEQTRLELEALPTYMFNFSDEQKNEIYKELTGRYFGRDSDNVVYQDISNIVQEQIRLSHEVLKSALEKK